MSNLRIKSRSWSRAEMCVFAVVCLCGAIFVESDVGGVVISSAQEQSERNDIGPDASLLDQAHALGVSISRSQAAKSEAAVRRFPTLGSCLLATPRGFRTLTIDWDRIGRDSEASVCLARVAHQIGTVDGITRWLQVQGFRVGRLRRASKYEFSRDVQEDEGTVIDAGWSIKKQGALERRGMSRVFQHMGYGVGVSIFVGRSGKVRSVQVITNIL